jgi:hypothetical protein
VAAGKALAPLVIRGEKRKGLNMKWRATVRRTTGFTKHFIGTIVDDLPQAVSEFAAPVTVEISAESDAFFLFRLGADGEFLGDTWHETLEEAKEQALAEYEIEEGDWVEQATE